jgi:hypothetical protein
MPYRQYAICPKCRHESLVLSDVYGAYCVNDECDYTDQALD